MELKNLLIAGILLAFLLVVGCTSQQAPITPNKETNETSLVQRPAEIEPPGPNIIANASISSCVEDFNASAWKTIMVGETMSAGNLQVKLVPKEIYSSHPWFAFELSSGNDTRLISLEEKINENTSIIFTMPDGNSYKLSMCELSLAPYPNPTWARTKIEQISTSSS